MGNIFQHSWDFTNEIVFESNGFKVDPQAEEEQLKFRLTASKSEFVGKALNRLTSNVKLVHKTFPVSEETKIQHEDRLKSLPKMESLVLKPGIEKSEIEKGNLALQSKFLEFAEFQLLLNLVLNEDEVNYSMIDSLAVCHSLFVSSDKFIAMLQQSYLGKSKNRTENGTENDSEDNAKTQVQIRVIQIMKRWVDLAPQSLNSIKEFAKFRVELTKLGGDHSEYSQFLKLYLREELRKRIIPKFNPLNSPLVRKISFLSVSPKEWARQVTAVDWKLFQAIRPEIWIRYGETCEKTAGKVK